MYVYILQKWRRNTFLKRKFRECVAHRSTLKEMLKGVLQWEDRSKIQSTWRMEEHWRRNKWRWNKKFYHILNWFNRQQDFFILNCIATMYCILYVCGYLLCMPIYMGNKWEKHDKRSEWKDLRIFSYYKVFTLSGKWLSAIWNWTLTVFKCTMQMFFIKRKW